MKIVVVGTPAPQGSKKFVGMHGGHANLVESSKKVKPWRESVKWAAREIVLAAKGAPGGFAAFDSPVRVRMIFTMKKPKSAPKGRVTRPDRTPDLSKLARSTEDALTEAGVWADDARVVEYSRLAKVFPNEDPEALDVPGVVITVEKF